MAPITATAAAARAGRHHHRWRQFQLQGHAASRADVSPRNNIDYVDCGTSGGVWGLAEGYSMMIGGDAAAVERLRPIFETLAPAPDQGWGRVGPVGAGHFTKMIHNGIEYGLMQAYAEGFSILQHKTRVRSRPAPGRRDLALRQRRAFVAARSDRRRARQESDDGRHRAVRRRFRRRPLDGEPRRSISTCPRRSSRLSLIERLRSRDSESFTDKLLSAMRNEFGGHAIKKE